MLGEAIIRMKDHCTVSGHFSKQSRAANLENNCPRNGRGALWFNPPRETTFPDSVPDRKYEIKNAKGGSCARQHPVKPYVRLVTQRQWDGRIPEHDNWYRALSQDLQERSAEPCPRIGLHELREKWPKPVKRSGNWYQTRNTRVLRADTDIT